MRCNVIKGLVGIACFIVILNVAAQPLQSTDLNQVKQAIEKQDFAQALKILLQNEQHLGDAEYDFLLGIAQFNTGQVQEAVFALERVVTLKPENHMARFFLAQSYVATNQTEAGLKQLNSLLATNNLDLQLREKVRKLAAYCQQKLLADKKNTKQKIRLALGVDSNVNAGSSEDDIFIPSLGTIDLFDESKKIADQYYAMSYTAAHQFSIDQHSSIRLQGSISDYNQLSYSDYDRTEARVAIEYQLNAHALTYALQIGVEPLLLSGKYYRNRTSVALGIDFPSWQRWQFNSQLEIGDSKNRYDNALSMQDLGLTLEATKFSQDFFVKFSAAFMQEDSAKSSYSYNSKQITSLNAYYGRQFTSDYFLYSYLSFQTQRFNDKHPVFLDTRRDYMRVVGFNLQYRYSSKWQFDIDASYSDKNSNLVIFDYNRIMFTANASYNF